MRRRAGRAALAVLVALASWAAIWWRPAIPATGFDHPVEAHPMDLAGHSLGPFALTGAWRLQSQGPGFHGLSALAIVPDGRFFAISDKARWFRFPRPGDAGPSEGGTVEVQFPEYVVAIGDTEAVVHDGASGRFWLAMENRKAIVRYDPDGSSRLAETPLMRDWDPNLGPEAFVRLADGRFVAIAEGLGKGTDPVHPALLYAGDPIESGDPLPFHFRMPGGVKPVEAALLPDGRVLVLGRDFRLPFRFVTTLAIADPAEIHPGSVWDATEVARLRGWRLSENYEGMAVEAGRDGHLTIWLLSDDNEARLIQKTILLRLETETGALRPKAGSARRNLPQSRSG